MASETDFPVLILAGGLGTRLRSVRPGVPKPMVDIGGKPFLQYQIESLKRAGLTRIVLCVGYRHEVIRDYFGDGRDFGVSLAYSVEPKPLGTAGALAFASDLVDETCFVLNGDTFVHIPYLELMAFHQSTGADVTLSVGDAPDGSDYGNIQLNSDGIIQSFDEKPAMPVKNQDGDRGGDDCGNGNESGSEHGAQGKLSVGTYCFEPEVLKSLPQGRAVSLEMEIFPALIEAGAKIAAYPIKDGFYDIGTPERLKRFEDFITRSKGVLS